MAKISDTQLALLRPDFGTSNQLMNTGLESLLKSLDPIKTQVDSVMAERKANATGSLMQQISQSMPTDYNNNPEARALFDSQISQFAVDNNLGREGVNNQDIFSTLNTLSTERDTNRGAVLGNQAKQLANTGLQDEQIYNQAFNNYASGKISKEEYESITNGLVANRQNNQNKTSIDNLAIANGGLLPQVELAKFFQDGRITPTIEKLLGGLNNTLNSATNRGGMGKSKAPSYQGQSFGLANDGVTNNPAIARYAPMITNAANKHGLSSSLIASMMDAESGGDPNARSSAGAGGLMQVMPNTWKGLSNGDRFDPNTNIDVGSQYMAEQLNKYSKYGDDALKLSLMAYNWGPGNTDRWIKNGGKIPKETTDYVAKVTSKLEASRGNPDPSQRNPFMDYGSDNNQPVNPNDVIKYANQKQTRRLPASDKLVNAAAPVMAQMGLTMRVHSGGQDDNTGRVGSNRHDHGNSVDADFYQGDRKLSFKNPKDIPVLQEMVQRLKANGLTGFGAGDGYMTDGRMHIGYGSSAVWGKDGSNASAYDWLKQAASSDVSGYASNDMLYQQANQPIIRPEDLEALQSLSNRVGAREDTMFDTLYANMQASAPNPITPALFSEYQSPEMLSQRNQGLMGNLNTIQDTNIENTNDLSQLVGEFENTINDRSQVAQDAMARLEQDMASGGEVVGVDNYVKNQGMFKKWLFESGVTPEMFDTFPTNIQGALIKAQMGREQNFGKKDRTAIASLKAIENNMLTSDSSYLDVAKGRLAQRAEERRVKEVENVGTGFLGFGKNDTSKYLDKKANFESGIAIYIDKAIKENPESFLSDVNSNKFLVGTNGKNIDALIDLVTKEYDKIISKADKPKTEYLSKNLSGNGMYINAKTINQAVNNALLAHSKSINTQIKKKLNKESTDPDIAASDIIANIAIADNLKKEK